MRQRLGLAQALLPENEVILLDEPTNGLDPEGIHEMRELIQRLNRERGLTVVFCSHLLVEVEQLCDCLLYTSGLSMACIGWVLWRLMRSGGLLVLCMAALGWLMMTWLGIYFASVSYTHLDVYKRQI